MDSPFISICIPSYQRVNYLVQLLDSIALQSFKDFEVIITDDSPTDEVKDICQKYEDKFSLHYVKNHKTLGTPENWNESIRKAKGEWIKIMHDDDWFSDANSLALFAKTAKEYPHSFIFSSFVNVYFPAKDTKQISPSSFRLSKLKQNPVTLLSNNCIGVPSVTMYKRSVPVQYDATMKWLVDIDFYIQILADNDFFHINEHLINVGLSESQVTAMCQNNPDIEIPEYLQVLHKTGTIHLRNVMVYDAWWRLFRNFRIKDMAQLETYAKGKCPASLSYILKDVNKWPTWLLKWGVASKLLMLFSFYTNKGKIV